MNAAASYTQDLINGLVQSVGAKNAHSAIREKARSLIQLATHTFGGDARPPDVDVLASLRGIKRSNELPVHSLDAELVPDGAGGVSIRVHPDRPETRQRFSVAHEISHTFFPDYATKAWCRTDARFRDRDNPDDYLEMLCDIGAAELLLPTPWFTDDASSVHNAQALVNLAARYRASREATTRRFAETNDQCVAALFLSWKLKPTQSRSLNPDQGNLWGTDPAEEMLAARELRIDYAIPSQRFAATGDFLPKDKSLDLAGPIEQAANGTCSDGEIHLALGAGGMHRVIALPLYTPAEECGPNGESAIVAVIEPLIIKAPKRNQNRPADDAGLF